MNRLIKYITIMMTGTLVFSACSSELDIDPSTNEIIQPDFNSIDDIEASLYGVYSALKSDKMFTQDIVALGEWTADNLKIAPENVGFGAIIHEWDYTESDATIESAWIGIYDLVRRANFVIEGVESYTGPDTQRAAEFKAQALVLKSFAILEAHRLFGQQYENGTELSVVYVNNANDIMQQNARLTTDELFQLLKADIGEALQSLVDQNNVNLVSPAFAYGLLARMAAFERDWNELVAQSSNAVDASGVDISSISDYAFMWGENNEDGEAIFKLALDSDDTKLGDLYFNDGVGPVFDPSLDVVQLYSQNDVRLASFFRLDPAFGPIISKFYGPASNRGLFETQIMRLSELYLLRAEANAELGQFSNALQDLDAIRSNRIENFSSTGESGDALIEAIRTERRKELLYEGFRFSDLRRWSQDVERNDCSSDECLLEAGDFKFSFAIPRAEIFANDNMIQNPGY